MASLFRPSVSLAGAAASDLFGGSSGDGAGDFSLRALGRARLGTRGGRGLTVVTAKLRKVKKHEYPWPEDPDPNVKGGILSHLSPFKPLKEKPKPVTLEFEKPLMLFEKKIRDVRKMANETGLDFSDQIISLETKYQQALKDLYTHLTPIQRVNIARHPNRPTFLDHVFNITDKFVELHGDRAGYDDPAIVTGIGTIDGERYMFMGHQKGRNTKENIQRNFGMPTPHGYRKALRMMYYAEHHGFPIITFIDTPGAFADLKSEELGQGEAIAHNLRTMFGIKVPIVSIVMGEGGSGGALAIGCANKLLMLENAVFYVASPEACAAILWKTAKASPKAAEKLKITATELCKLQIADGIIPEPLGGAHADPSWTSQQIKAAVVEAMNELKKMGTQELLKHRTLKFRKIGGFQEGIPVDPKRKVNMKMKEEPPLGMISEAELESEVEKLKQKIADAKESSTEVSDNGLDELIEKLQKEVDHEYSEAIKAMGLDERISTIRKEFAKAKQQEQPLHPILMDKIDKLKKEVNQGLSGAPNYESLKSKLDMLNELSKVKNAERVASQKEELNRKLKEVLERPDLKEKVEALNVEIEHSGATAPEDVDEGLMEKIVNLKKEIDMEMASVIESFGLHVEAIKPTSIDTSTQTSVSEVGAKMKNLDKEINNKIEEVVNSSDLKDMMEMLKMEIVKAGKTPDLSSKNKIEDLQQQIKQRLFEAINSSELREQHEELTAEISEVVESFGGSNGSLRHTDSKDGSKHEESRVEVSVGGYGN
ncbi:acetyl-coenzyme A carboxylase carboxyl transferase subunit alpha, chloroplastic [Rhodamnia argentea]|uniref:acetyl-CoA carboxytransferase n=1 Tax=Rhodamnia argentea TaxID=178133 RepID=A0A8B8PQS3_9MYRT|nr:acetyl-coenzyme A carboxylase carboxyl transferase subunit alpha, chloroplastic [Rhodamnia argentea]XP_048127136.1 acetyl-coenzyme A carboxylase carboxyl transferase subunit alpha, chloroplastic [Rhodamnia argentea]